MRDKSLIHRNIIVSKNNKAIEIFIYESFLKDVNRVFIFIPCQHTNDYNLQAILTIENLLVNK